MEKLSENYNRYIKTSFNEMNSNSFQQNDYNTVYSKPDTLSVIQEPDQQADYTLVDHYLCLSSKERDITLFPDPNTYTIHFSKEFKNISSIELIQAIIPDKNNVTREPFLLVKIAELEDVISSNDRNITDSFAILQMTRPTEASYFVNIDKKIHENVTLQFHTPKASLSKMTITITDCDGVPFDFDGVGDLSKLYQNTLIFRISCFEKNRKQLSHRNVY